MRAVILGFILIRCFVNGHASEEATIAMRSPNAALSYLQAFAALPQFDADETSFLDGFLEEGALADTQDWRADSIEEYQSIRLSAGRGPDFGPRSGEQDAHRQAA